MATHTLKKMCCRQKHVDYVTYAIGIRPTSGGCFGPGEEPIYIYPEDRLYAFTYAARCLDLPERSQTPVYIIRIQEPEKVLKMTGFDLHITIQKVGNDTFRSTVMTSLGKRVSEFRRTHQLPVSTNLEYGEWNRLAGFLNS